MVENIMRLAVEFAMLTLHIHDNVEDFMYMGKV